MSGPPGAGEGEAPRLGSMFGRYRIEQVVGRGGMGVVVRATDVELQRTVALKFVAPELARDPVARERFLREARLAAAIEHPNIVPIHEVGEADGTLFLVMRAIPGPDLATVLRRDAPLDLARTLAIAAPIADALDAAHRRGLVHRDVKPGNVLLEPGEAGGPERPWLTDFGLTRRLADTAPMTVDGWLGTLDYVAPELIDGGEIGPWTDQYSLACLIVHCLTGGPPWEGPTEAAVLYGHVHGDRAALARRVPGDEVAAVLARGLAPVGRDRYPDCRTLVAALAMAAGAGREGTDAPATPDPGSADRPTAPLPPAPSSARGRRQRRHPVVLVVLLAVLLAGGLLLAVPRPGVAPGPSTDPEAEDATSAPIVLATGGLIVFAGGQGNELDLWAVRPDGSGLRRLTDLPGRERWPVVTPGGDAVIYTAGSIGARDLWLLPLDGGPARQLTRHGGDDYAAALSSDGKRLLWTSNRDGDADIWMMEDTGDGFGTGRVVNLTDAPGEDNNHLDIFPAWAPDGSGFVFASNRAAGADILWMDPARPDPPEFLTKDPLPFVDMSPVVAPDGSVVFVGRREHPDRDLYRVSRDGVPERLTNLGDEVGGAAFSPDGALLVAPVGLFDDAVTPIETRLMLLDPASGRKRGVIRLDLPAVTDPDWVATLAGPVPSPGT